MTLRNTKDSFYHARAADTYLYVCLFIKTGGGVGLKKFVTPTHVEDLPDAPELNRLYLVGSEAQPWSAALLCPCGCCSLIQLSLIGGDDLRWTLSYDVNRSVTLHPSIWRIKGCRSHFVRANEIIWARGGRRFGDTASPQRQPNGRLLDRTIGR